MWSIKHNQWRTCYNIQARSWYLKIAKHKNTICSDETWSSQQSTDNSMWSIKQNQRRICYNFQARSWYLKIAKHKNTICPDDRWSSQQSIDNLYIQCGQSSRTNDSYVIIFKRVVDNWKSPNTRTLAALMKYYRASKVLIHFMIYGVRKSVTMTWTL